MNNMIQGCVEEEGCEERATHDSLLVKSCYVLLSAVNTAVGR